MAVIKPLTNSYQNTTLDFSDLSTKTLYNVAEEDESDLIRYNPPITPPMMHYGQIPACGPVNAGEEVELYRPQHLQPNPIVPRHVIMEHLLEEEVVGEFSSHIHELNDMMSTPEAASGGMPVYHQAHLIQQDPVLPLHMDLFDDEPNSPPEEDEMDREQFGLLQGYMYNNAQIHNEEGLVEVKSAVEGSLALMPPSPFRDCAAAPPASPFAGSPVSESILCSPTNVTYASVILKDYKQSSSTL